MIKSARADCEKIWVLMMALFCGNTLCIARKSDEIRAQIFRKMPQAIYSAFTGGEGAQCAHWADEVESCLSASSTNASVGGDAHIAPPIAAVSLRLPADFL